MALKTGPKIILIALLVGAFGYGANFALTKYHTSRPAVVQDAAQDQASAPTAPAPTQTADPVPTQAAQVPAPVAPTANVTNGDAGLSAVLQAGKK
jgi:hypothetical protein